MRKLRKARSAADVETQLDDERNSDRPRCISGATITSWHGAPEIDLSALFSNPSRGPSVSGAATATSTKTNAKASPEITRTVSLSDGTSITFLALGQVKAITTV